jgi:very-short-patch-repair endonuclease
VRKAANQILGGQDLAWRELLKVTKDLDIVGDRVRRVAGLKVAGLGEHETAKIKSDAKNLIQHLEAGGKLGFGPFRSKVVKEAKYLIREVRVNGNSCDNPQSLRKLIEWIEIADHLDLLRKHWSICTDPPSGPFDTQVAEYHDLCKPLGKALELKEIIVGLKKKIAVIQGLAEPNWRDLEGLKAIKQAIKAVTLEKNLAAFQGKLQDLETQIHVMAMKSKAHSAVHQLLNAVRARDERSYDAAYTILDGLVKSRREFEIRNDLLGRLKAVAPELALELRSSYEDSVWNTRMGHFSAAWNWGRANRWLKKLNEPHIYETLANNLESCKSRMCNIILDLTQAKAWKHCFSRLTEYDRQHLMAWTKAVRRIGKGTGKYASMHRREARKHMEECRSAIPAWIMPIYRVAETIRPGKDAFDVVIVDEASQSGPEALFLHFLAKQIVVVGDDKQISPEFIGITREDVELLRQRYLSGIPHSDALGVDNSFFDQAEIRYPGRIRLREHFRCMPEIIQFSNNLCYGSEPLIPLRQYAAGRLSPVIVTHHVSDGYQKGASPRVVNPPEAEAIVDKISRCCEDPAYDGKTMGVISLLGQDQARLIERLLLDEIGPEEMEKRNLVCGDAYAFQGDERDIMFLSLVSAPTEGQRIGTLASPRDERRFNVAASRAKDQMWLFHSVTLNDLSPRCLRYQLLEYCQNPKVQPTSLEGLDLGKLREISRLADRDRVSPPEPFESWFELDVFLKIVEHGYRVIPQFEVAGYFIDLVVEGMEGRLAVECDGDEWHGLERYEQDQARQRQLERCGWTFWRVPGSTFYRDPEEALEVLWQVLKRLKIYPESEESESVSEGGPSRAEEHSSATKSEPSPDDESQIDSESAKERLVEKEGEVGEEETREKPVQQELFRGTTEKKEKERAESVKRRKGGEISRKSEEKTKVAKKGVTRIDPSDLVDPLPHILFNLLPEHEWKCGKCGRTRQILIGPFGPYLKCSNRKCRKTKKIAHAILTEAFHILQIPCAECGSPMVITIGYASLPSARCNQFPKCKAVESWIDLNKRIKQKDVRLQLGGKM